MDMRHFTDADLNSMLKHRMNAIHHPSAMKTARVAFVFIGLLCGLYSIIALIDRARPLEIVMLVVGMISVYFSRVIDKHSSDNLIMIQEILLEQQRREVRSTPRPDPEAAFNRARQAMMDVVKPSA